MSWRRNKYRAIKTVVDGVMFDSKKEARRYGELKILLQTGKIRDLAFQPAYPITINGQQVCIVKFDFRYWCNGRQAWIDEDVKGLDNKLSQLKRKLVAAQYGIKVVLV